METTIFLGTLIPLLFSKFLKEYSDGVINTWEWKPRDLRFCVEIPHHVTWGLKTKKIKNKNILDSVLPFLACLLDRIDTHLQKLGEL